MRARTRALRLRPRSFAAVTIVSVAGLVAFCWPLLVSPDSGLAGRTIEQVLSGNRTIVVLGIRRSGGQVMVAPPPLEELCSGDRVIVVGDPSELDAIQRR